MAIAAVFAFGFASCNNDDDDTPEKKEYTGIYFMDTYNEPGIHDDQEGFYVVEGSGQARVGDDEFDIRPGSAFIAAKGVPHSIKRNPDSGPIKVVWSHGPV